MKITCTAKEKEWLIDYVVANKCPFPFGCADTDCRKCMEKEIEWIIDDPDRVKVVRCRDCRYWEPPTDFEADDGSTTGHCRNNYAPCQNQQTDMNWFCADGEREG